MISLNNNLNNSSVAKDLKRKAGEANSSEASETSSAHHYKLAYRSADTLRANYKIANSDPSLLLLEKDSNLSENLKEEDQEAKGLLKKPFKKSILGLVGHPLNSTTLNHYSSKAIVYSFNKINNLSPLLSKTEYLLKSLFLSMYSLISRPIYLIRHDKIIIRLFVFLSPKADKYLDTSTIVKGAKLRGASSSVFNLKGKSGVTLRKITAQQIRKFLKFKSLRPKTVEILKSQIKLTPSSLFSLPSLSSYLTQYKTGDSKAGTIVTYPYTSLMSNFKTNLEKLSVIFSKIFKKKVEFEIIKAQLPFQDANILAQILGYNANNYKFRRMLKILIPRAVIKNPSKELTPPSLYPMLASLNLLSINESDDMKSQTLLWSGWGAKDLNIVFSQPSSYLPPFFYSKDYIKGLNSVLLSRLLRGSESRVHQTTAEKVRVAGLEGSGSNNLFTTSLPFAEQLPSGVCQATIVKGVSNKQILPSYLSGMNIKLAGRLMTQSMRPRFTEQSHQEGSLARVKVHYTEKSRFTGKNKRGAFSFTVTISHVLN